MSCSVVLAPGLASVGSAVFEPLIEQLHQVGLTDTHAVDFPSVDCLDHLDRLAGNPLQADIDHLRTLLRRLIEQENKNVLVVAHSYGGTPVLAACEGLWKHTRPGRPGVVKVALLASSLALPGHSVPGDRMEWQQANGETQADSGFRVEMKGPTLVFYPDGTKEAWLNDLPPDQAQKWYETFRPSAVASAPSPAQTVGDWRVAYLVTTELDQAMPEPFQRHLVEQAKSAGAQLDPVTVIKSGHFVHVSHPEEVARWVRGLC